MNTKSSQTWYGLSWLFFSICLFTTGIGIYNMGMPKSVQGYFVQSVIVITICSFNLQKSLKDKDDGVQSVTGQWMMLTWGAFILSIITIAIGIWNLDAPLSVKGFYSQSIILLIGSSVNLQKVTMERDMDAKKKPIGDNKPIPPIKD